MSTMNSENNKITCYLSMMTDVVSSSGKRIRFSGYWVGRVSNESDNFVGGALSKILG